MVAKYTQHKMYHLNHFKYALSRNKYINILHPSPPSMSRTLHPAEVKFYTHLNLKF